MEGKRQYKAYQQALICSIIHASSVTGWSGRQWIWIDPFHQSALVLHGLSGNKSINMYLKNVRIHFQLKKKKDYT